MDIRSINIQNLSRDSLHVRVIKIDSPLLIWVQLYYAREDLEELFEALTSRMARRERELIHNPMLPDKYVAIEKGKTWQ